MDDLIDITREVLRDLGYSHDGYTHRFPGETGTFTFWAVDSDRQWDRKELIKLHVFIDPPQWALTRDGELLGLIDLHDPKSFEMLKAVLDKITHDHVELVPTTVAQLQVDHLIKHRPE
jgi:hypothetical protein